MDLRVLSIIIGVLGAVVGIYFRENFRIAKRQKIILTKLRAFLQYQQRENLLSFKDYAFIKTLIFELPIEKNYEYNVKEVDSLIISINTKCKFLKWKIEKEKVDSKYKNELTETFKEIKNKEGVYLFHSVEELKELKKDIKQNVIFISDEEAALFDYKLTYLIINYKVFCLYTISDLIKIFKYCENKEEMEFKEYHPLLWKLIENTSCYKNLGELLLTKVLKESKINTTFLAIKNIFS